MSDNPQRNRGVVISGGVGCGKTAVLEQLLEQSAFETGMCGLVSSGKCNQTKETFLRDS